MLCICSFMKIYLLLFEFYLLKYQIFFTRKTKYLAIIKKKKNIFPHISSYYLKVILPYINATQWNICEFCKGFHVFTYVHIWFIFGCISIYKSISVYHYITLYIYIYLHICLYISIYFHISLYISIYLYISLYISIYLYL